MSQTPVSRHDAPTTTDPDQQLDALFASLPRAAATEGFATRVVRQSRRPQDSRSGLGSAAHRAWRQFSRPMTRLALATAAAAVVAAFVLRPLHRPTPSFSGHDTAGHGAAAVRTAASSTETSGNATTQTQQLQAEYQRLAAELEALEALRARARPVVYLGSGTQTDFVLDLDRLARQRSKRTNRAPNTPAGRVIPARY